MLPFAMLDFVTDRFYGRQTVGWLGCRWAIRAVVGLLLLTPAQAQVQIDGDLLTLTTENMKVQFRGGTMIRLTNLLTGETLVRQVPVLPSLVEMRTLQTSAKPLRWTDWRMGKATAANPNAVQISFNDLTSAVWMNAIIDPDTQDVALTLWGESNREGVTGLTWGMRGLDLTSGRLILPAFGGIALDSRSAPDSLTLEYPGQWEAQMLIWQTQAGGFVVYSRDDQALFKRLHLRRRGDRLDLIFETQAVGPWKSAGGVPQLEWRFNVFKGDWRVPAEGYRRLMRFLRPPLPARGDRAWVAEIRSVRTIAENRFDPATLEKIAALSLPKETLLYLPNWHIANARPDDPAYRVADNLRVYVQRAQAMGFRVMLGVDCAALPREHPDLIQMRRYQVKDPRTGAPVEIPAEGATSAPSTLAVINPAAPAYRSLFIRRLSNVIDYVRPDALHLRHSGRMWNDGGGLIEKQNFAQGAAALHRALLTAFPHLVLSGDGLNEVVAPFQFFAQLPPAVSLPPHPISGYLFGDRMLFFLPPSSVVWKYPIERSERRRQRSARLR
jgi:hypothetical protein